jgi:hypothetical protein
MKKALSITVLILLSALAFSQELIIVVAPFDVKEGAGFSKNDAENIEYLLSNELSKSKTIKVLDQSETMFKETIKRMEFELSDWSNPKKVAEFGKAVNANAVLLGRIMILDNEIIIAVRINDLNTEIKAANDMVVTKVSEVRSKLPAFTKEILERLPKPPPTTIKAYQIGDTGPTGGIIFFDRGFTGDGWQYLEAAPAGSEFTAQWGAYQKDVANTMTAVNFGKQNTKLIIDRLKALGETYRAAQICATLDINGYKDWFLPSKDELNLMYKNLKQKGLGGFSNDWYWSSSQGNNNLALAQRFSDGEQSNNSKSSMYLVRAVRAFAAGDASPVETTQPDPPKEKTPPTTPPPPPTTPPPPREKELKPLFNNDNKFFWGIGASVGSSFATPWAIGTIQLDISPFSYTIIELGCDFGLIHGYERKDIEYYSYYPFGHLLFTPFIKKEYDPEPFVLYAGIGGGVMLSSYKTATEDNSFKTPAADATAGFYLGSEHHCLHIYYTLRTTFKAFNHKAAAGYTYRF